MIPGYEGLYMVSNLGRVKSLNYNHTGKEEILKPEKGKHGHLRVCLCDGQKKSRISIHRLVAIVFIPIPEIYKNMPMSKLDVHHKNFIPWDNRAENLCWLTKKEHNALHKSKKVYRYGLDGKFIDEWPSLCEIQMVLGYDIGGISRCCLGIDKTAYGFQWSYEKHDSIPPVKSRYERIGEKHSKQVGQYDLDGNLIKIWPSMAEIQRQLGYFSTAISACCRGVAKIAYGFIWKYA